MVALLNGEAEKRASTIKVPNIEKTDFEVEEFKANNVASLSDVIKAQYYEYSIRRCKNISFLYR